MEIDLLKIVSEGGTPVALIAVVVLFLNHVSKINGFVKDLVNGFQDHIAKQSEQYVMLTRETAVALKGLEDAVRELQSKIKA
jgi:hypothetical protein